MWGGYNRNSRLADAPVGYNQAQGSSVTLPNVSDPQQALADITYQQYQDYVTNFQDYEKELIEKATTDTSLIDQAREDAPEATRVAAESQRRSIGRYGANLTPAPAQEMNRSVQRGGQLSLVDALTNARVAQQEQNSALLSNLINIGQGLNRSALGQLGSAAQNQSAREQAYSSARAQSKASTIGTIGALGAAAIMFL